MRVSTTRLTALLLGFLLVASAAQAQLSGTYYVGAPGTAPIGNPDYATLKAAADAANAGGVTGNVTLLVTSNLTEAAEVGLGVNTGGFSFTIKPAPGVSPVVTFTTTTLAADAAAYIQGHFVVGSATRNPAALVPTNNVVIDGSNTVGGTTRDMTFRSASTANYRPTIRSFGSNDNLTIKNLVVDHLITGAGGAILVSTYGPDGADDLTIENNSITSTGGASTSAITVARSALIAGPTNSATGMRIVGNALTFRLRGANIQWRDRGEISGNTFTIVAGSADSKGVIVLAAPVNAAGTLNIHSNRFAALATSSATGLMGVDNQIAEGPVVVNVYNNTFTGFSTTAAATNQRIFAVRHAFALTTTNVYHNTVYMADLTNLTTPGTTIIAAFAFVDNVAGNNTAPTGTMNVQNNLVVLEETTMKVRALYRAGTAGTFTSDGNVVSTPGADGHFGVSNGTDRTTLDAWRDATLQDRNSRVKAPTFASTTTLALSGASLGDADLTGLALAAVTTDIDGAARSATAPYVGADEAAPALAARIVNLTAGVTGNATASEIAGNGGRFWASFNTGFGSGVGIEINSLAAGVPTGDYQRFACTFDDATVGRPAGANYRCDVYTTPAAFPSNPTTIPASFKNATVRYQFFTADYGTLSTNEANFTGFNWTFSTDAGGSPLPVELSAFEAVASGSGARLTWTTESETNNAGFAVEQQTGGAFAELDFVAGKGTTLERTTYRYDVASLAAGRHTFRLKQVDVDGTATYSPTVEVTIGLDGQVELSNAAPNPFTATTGLSLRLAREQRVSVKVYDLSGRHVQTLHDGVLVAGEAHRFTFDGADLSSGVYLVRVTGEHFAQTRQVTLVR